MLRLKSFLMPVIVPLMILVFTLFISGVSAEKLFAMGSNGGLVQPHDDKKDKGQSDDNENNEAQPLEKESDDNKAEKPSSKKKKSHLKYMDEGS